MNEKDIFISNPRTTHHSRAELGTQTGQLNHGRLDEVDRGWGGESMIKDVGKEMIKNIAEDTSNGCLIRAARTSCPRDDDESVEYGPERSDTEDNARNNHLDLPKVERQGATEQQERNL